MHIDDDTFALLLLTMALSPDNDEFIRPLSPKEYSLLEGKLQSRRLRPRILIGMDISGIMMNIGLSEEEAYRLFVLMNRDVQITYMLEEIMQEGIDLLAKTGVDYPRALRYAMKENTPPFFYLYGDRSMLECPKVGILGVSGVKTGSVEKEMIRVLTDTFLSLGYRICTGTELGVCGYVADAVRAKGISPLTVTGGGLRRFSSVHPEEDALSCHHPDTGFSLNYAADSNKMLFGLCDAVFILNTDGKHGELEAMQQGYCRNVYVWNGRRENGELIAKGAIPFASLDEKTLRSMSEKWKENKYEQISIFDM